MANVVLPFTGGRRCVICKEQIHPGRVRANPDIATCDAGCTFEQSNPGDEGRVAPATQETPRDTLSL